MARIRDHVELELRRGLHAAASSDACGHSRESQKPASWLPTSDSTGTFTAFEMIMAIPNVETTDPAPVRLAGAHWLQMDVTFSEEGQVPCLWIREAEGDPGGRMRLYLIDPDESPTPYLNVLMIAVVASETDFEHVLEQATPFLESVEFHPG